MRGSKVSPQDLLGCSANSKHATQTSRLTKVCADIVHVRRSRPLAAFRWCVSNVLTSQLVTLVTTAQVDALVHLAVAFEQHLACYTVGNSNPGPSAKLLHLYCISYARGGARALTRSHPANASLGLAETQLHVSNRRCTSTQSCPCL